MHAYGKDIYLKVNSIFDVTSLEGMMLKLKLQCFGHITRRFVSLEKTLMLGGIGGKKRSERQRKKGNIYHLNWRRQWHPTPVLLPGKSHGRRSLVGCSPWGHEESDTTEQLQFHFHALEKEMATHSSVLAWRIPEMGEPGGLPSVGSHRVGHD